MLYNIYKSETKNIGDINSSPLLYFKFPDFTRKICISDKLDLSFVDKNDILIIGGGGLVYKNKKDEWDTSLKKIAFANSFKTIFWGAGLNYHCQGCNVKLPDYINCFSLVGIRDYGLGCRWVPCPSCMHTILDDTFILEREIGVVEHFENPLDLSLPKIKNNTFFHQMISFIGGSEKIVTNSYHGVYWSILMKKKVIAIPVDNSSRFYFFKHKPKIQNHINLDFSDCEIYENALSECRQANQNFYEEFIDKFYSLNHNILFL